MVQRLREFLRNREFHPLLREKIDFCSLVQDWAEIVGFELARCSLPLSVCDDLLLVVSSGAKQAHMLELKKKVFIGRINNRYDWKLTGLRAVVSGLPYRPTPSAPRPKKKMTVTDEEINRCLEGMPSFDLAERLARIRVLNEKIYGKDT